jgi:hypothetical protein
VFSLRWSAAALATALRAMPTMIERECGLSNAQASLTIASPGSGAAHSAAPLDDTGVFPDDSDGCSVPTGGALLSLRNSGGGLVNSDAGARVRLGVVLWRRQLNFVRSESAWVFSAARPSWY